MYLSAEQIQAREDEYIRRKQAEGLPGTRSNSTIYKKSCEQTFGIQTATCCPRWAIDHGLVASKRDWQAT